MVPTRCLPDMERCVALQASAPGPMLAGSQGLLPRWANAFLPSGEGPIAAPVGSCFLLVPAGPLQEEGTSVCCARVLSEDS